MGKHSKKPQIPKTTYFRGGLVAYSPLIDAQEGAEAFLLLNQLQVELGDVKDAQEAVQRFQEPKLEEKGENMNESKVNELFGLLEAVDRAFFDVKRAFSKAEDTLTDVYAALEAELEETALADVDDWDEEDWDDDLFVDAPAEPADDDLCVLCGHPYKVHDYNGGVDFVPRG